MPYLGGASLSAVLARLWTDSRRVDSGEAFVRAMESVEAPRPDGLQKGKGTAGEELSPEGMPSSNEGTPRRPGTSHPPLAKGGMAAAAGGSTTIHLSAPPPRNGATKSEALAQTGDRPLEASEPVPDVSGLAKDQAIPLTVLRSMSYERTSAWIVAQLAEGLHHAHQRGILHRDIKPSNILISAEGQPLLLDFNLAQTQDQDPAHATIGGTVAYMSPEHLRALVGRTPALIGQVDCRSDIYSLGMVLVELLTGQRPFDRSGSYSALPVQIEAMAAERSQRAPSIRADRPDLSWGLESIARRCLAPEPSARYQQAGHLADDLRRWLEDRPLRYAPELSRVERARKFAAGIRGWPPRPA